MVNNKLLVEILSWNKANNRKYPQTLFALKNAYFWPSEMIKDRPKSWNVCRLREIIVSKPWLTQLRNKGFKYSLKSLPALRSLIWRELAVTSDPTTARGRAPRRPAVRPELSLPRSPLLRKIHSPSEAALESTEVMSHTQDNNKHSGNGHCY